MKAMNSTEAGQWCSEVGLVMQEYALRFETPGEHKFFVEAPEEHRMIAALAYHILAFRDEVSFSGGLLWLQRWDIGSPQLVRPGWRILEDIRRAHGEFRSLEAAPVQFFRDDEFVELHAFLIQVMGFGWVTDYVPGAGRFFLHFKDNRQIRITADSQQILKELRTAFQKWNPTDEDPMVEKLRSMEKSREIG
jgi:hypothetical protein